MNTYKKTNYSIDSDIIIEEVDSVLITTAPKKVWKSKRTLFEIDTVYYVREGEYNVYIGDNKIHMEENDVLYLPKGLPYYSESISKKMTFQGIYFYAKKDNPDDFFHTFQHIRNCKNLYNKFENIYKLFASNQFGKKLSSKKALYDILNHIMQKKMHEQNDFAVYYSIKNAIEYIENNYTNNDISISFLANLCNITPTYFTYIFKKIFGTTPKDYIINMRMEKAKEYLMYSSYTMNEVSEKLGYSNPAYFSSAFKKIYGVAPTEFKKNYN